MPKYYRKCKSCRKFFQVELMSIQIYCEKCKSKEFIPGHTNQHNYIQNIKYSRSISLDSFDVYDLERPIKNKNNEIIDYERVCRVCGAPLRNKKGGYSYHKRYCGTKQCNGGVLFNKFNWNECRFKYIKFLHEKQEKEIESELVKRKIDIESKYHFIFCEECNKLCKIHNGWWDNSRYWGSLELKGIERVEIHHKQPVYTLTEENILLIFDPSNLICLCESCHNKTKGIKKPKGPIKRFITIERWLYNA